VPIQAHWLAAAGFWWSILQLNGHKKQAWSTGLGRLNPPLKKGDLGRFK
jgi:hypothetical protein